jgi:hypothetical protein
MTHFLRCAYLCLCHMQIVLLLRLVPLLPFNVMNYLLSVTPISTTNYIFASWIGMMVRFAFLLCQVVAWDCIFIKKLILSVFACHICDEWFIANLPSQTMFFLVGLQPVTLTFVYVGTTIKDIADISHSGRHFTRARLVSCIIATLTTL